MRKLLDGLHHFQTTVFGRNRDLYEKLAKGQNPGALFITCSDSRVVPNVITQTEPGELFVLRNAGNIIPPYGASNGGEGATIEFALVGLGIRDIVVCGHSHCGAIRALLTPGSTREMPQLGAWLGHAEATRRLVAENYSGLDATAQINVATQEHVLVQLENLETHPVVRARLARGDLALHAWVYKIETGEVFAYSAAEKLFLPAGRAEPEVIASAATAER
jgi:carbonic anhydrase